MKVTPRSFSQDIEYGGELFADVGREMFDQRRFRKMSHQQAAAEN